MGAYIPYYGTEFVLDVIASLGLVLFAGFEVLIKSGRPQDRKHAGEYHLLLIS
uniref:Uncharacterized protein n=1 Tax=Daucus carota subsp. sativus TaxID=79200 RepID=A0A165WN25_DAUCS